MYESSLVEPDKVQDFIETVNSENYQIVSVTYLVDSQQVLFICNRPQPKKPLIKNSEDEEKE